MIVVKSLLAGIIATLLIPAVMLIVILLHRRPPSPNGGLSAYSVADYPTVVVLFLVGSCGYLAWHYLKH